MSLHSEATVEPSDEDCPSKFGDFYCQNFKGHDDLSKHYSGITEETVQIVPDPDHPGSKKMVVVEREGLLTWGN